MGRYDEHHDAWERLFLGPDPKTAGEIAEMYGCNQTTVGRALRARGIATRRRITRTPLKRFHDKVERDADTGCWRWTAYCTDAGYPQLKVDGEAVYAHVFAYEHFHGPVADGLYVHRSCQCTQCVAPDHLYLSPRKRER